tara:strand:+ start:16915 stop:17556 length:642 start_codon:yes stop_codon:yes gene_type:complete
MSELFDDNPYKGFYKPLGTDGQTWGGRKAIFADLVEQVRPSLVIEVGTWKGGSAISMGTRIKDLGLGGHVLCVDTWLGSIEHWHAKDDPDRRGYYDSLRLQHGYPRLYEQFMVNVINAGLEDVIIPFPATSHVAGEWLRGRGVVADMIYIDAGHGEHDVFADLVAYYPILREGGVLFGDDWQWDGVETAVTRFAKERSLTCRLVEDETMFVLS